MVVIAIALQERLLEAARRGLGAEGEAMLRATAQDGLATPFEQLTYAQLPSLFAAIERLPPRALGRKAATSLAGALSDIAATADTSLHTCLVETLTAYLGPSAAALLTRLYGSLDLAPTTVTRAHLPELAAAATEVSAFLGPDLAGSIAAAIEKSRTARLPDLVARVVQVAAEHIGPEGEGIVRRLCHERLEVDLDDLDLGGVVLLARVMAREGAEPIGGARIAAFLAAAREIVVSPAGPLRAKIVEQVNRRLGPVGPMFLGEMCARHGMPFDAVSYEHVAWLAETLRDEAAPLLGARGAEDLAWAVNGLLANAR